MAESLAVNNQVLVVLVDDDPLFLRNYAKGLRMFSKATPQFDVKTFSETKEVIQFARENQQSVAAYIVDSMMPHELNEFDPKVTQEGLFTGISLLKEIRRIAGSKATTKLVVLTNVANASLRPAIGDFPVDEILHKLSCTPRKLAEIIDRLVR